MTPDSKEINQIIKELLEVELSLEDLCENPFGESADSYRPHKKAVRRAINYLSDLVWIDAPPTEEEQKAFDAADDENDRLPF